MATKKAAPKNRPKSMSGAAASLTSMVTIKLGIRCHYRLGQFHIYGPNEYEKKYGAMMLRDVLEGIFYQDSANADEYVYLVWPCGHTEVIGRAQCTEIGNALLKASHEPEFIRGIRRVSSSKNNEWQGALNDVQALAIRRSLFEPERDQIIAENNDTGQSWTFTAGDAERIGNTLLEIGKLAGLSKSLQTKIIAAVTDYAVKQIGSALSQPKAAKRSTRKGARR